MTPTRSAHTARRRVLVTGAGGLLGSALAEVASHRSDVELVACRRAELEITDPEQVVAALARHRPDWVINAAAYTNVDGAERNLRAAIESNTLGPAVLAQQAALAGVGLVQVSTDHVFDGLATEPYDESATVNPPSVYGRTKAQGEVWALALQPRCYVVRTAGLFGVGGRNFVQAIAVRAWRGEALRVVDDQVCQRTYAPDLAEALLNLVIAEPEFGQYHVTNEGSSSWYQFARQIVDRLGCGVPVSPVASADYGAAAVRPAYSVLGSRRWRAACLPPLRPAEDALDEYLVEVRAELSTATSSSPDSSRTVADR